MVYTHIRSIFSNYMETFEMIQWSKENCPSFYKNDAKSIAENFDEHHIFYFRDEKDYLLFLLKWS